MYRVDNVNTEHNTRTPLPCKSEDTFIHNNNLTPNGHLKQIFNVL